MHMYDVPIYESRASSAIASCYTRASRAHVHRAVQDDITPRALGT